MSSNQPGSRRRSIHFETLPSGLTVLAIENEFSIASVSLFGGQVLTWQPTHTPDPVLWVSELASFDGNKAIRGGVPICWPWFGAHDDDRSLPGHGYARLRTWQIDSLQWIDDVGTELILSLPPAPDQGAGNLPGGRLIQTLRIGSSLDIALTTHNSGHVPLRISEGFHTYFQIANIDEVAVTGLEGRPYVDLTQDNRRDRQESGITFGAEVGRLFVGSNDSCQIEDRKLGRRIRVEKTGSLSTAVWNPGLEVASKMSDLGPGGWRTMVCVETANALEDTVVVAPGAEHTMGARYLVESLR